MADEKVSLRTDIDTQSVSGSEFGLPTGLLPSRKQWVTQPLTASDWTSRTVPR